MTIEPSIDPDRLWDRLMALAAIGALPHGGVDRQALTTGEADAWRLLIDWATPAGLEPSTDPAGNLFLTLPGQDRKAPPVLSGSHIDTQPTGGKFDGALGVVGALEAAVAIAESGMPRARDLAIVAWMNEEGSRFIPGMMGSESFVGERPLDWIRAVRDAAGTSVGEALDQRFAAFPDLPRRPLGFPVATFVELHIEQGPLLEAAGTTIGVVTGIQGKQTYEITLGGAEGHAGTLATADRRDALAAFARIASRLYREIGDHDPIVKFTIGRLRVEPNAPSVVPGKVVFAIDLRHPANDILTHLGERLQEICRDEAGPCSVDIRRPVDAPSNGFDEALRQRIVCAAADQGASSMAILSAAGHDSRHLAKICPTAMIFVPCRDGISHAEAEWTEPAQAAAGTAVLAQVLAELVTMESGQ